MQWNEHWRHRDSHAFLSPSKYHWLRYTPEKLAAVFERHQKALRGDAEHRLAAEHIRLGIKMGDVDSTLAKYINDAIVLGLRPEQTLYFSEDCYGHADAIGFDEEDLVLYVHDLKTGVTDGHMDQLMLYAGLFCFEYNINPFDIRFVLRIYQHNEIHEYTPDSADVHMVMEIIVSSDEHVQRFRKEL